MGELLGVVDVAALRPADRGSIETYLEVAFKHFGASNRRCTFRLIDTDHEGPLLDRLQHLGCREYLDAIRKQKGPSYIPGVASRMRALYTLSKSNALKVLLAAKESTGQSKLWNVSQAISTDMLQQLGASEKDDDTASPCVALLLRLPKTADQVAAFLQQHGAADADEPLLLPDASVDKPGFQAVLKARLRLLLDGWLASLREQGIRLLLLALGYDEAVATPPERLLALGLQELLLLHCPLGSSVVPVAVDEDDASDTQLDTRWPKSTLQLVLAGQPLRRRMEIKTALAALAPVQGPSSSSSS
ncbi:hypothetical protein OEZ85_006675 [Tetradesmus obliquus]|uniref:Uncharacterized protein n=1 Tax=Tetradesmus obliquus TaxID=3088 RepID=A0ABY8TXG5_TETOB|nr:hypothetical protein OEZ85_006675 [Tetradesmus obliquus]